jgi:hypothetical protein
MPTHLVNLTDDEELAYQARVVWLQEQSELVPPPFPPVVPVANVDALIAEQMVPPKISIVTWYLAQAE